MMLDYFYGQSGELFSYFRIPKALFQDHRFRQLSTDARTLYGILLDRMSLSVKNGWLDEQGRVYIIYTVREVQESLCCAEHKAVKLFRELEDMDLIERKRRGLGRPSLIYVKDFSSGLPKAQVQNKQQFEEGLRQNEQATTQPDDASVDNMLCVTNDGRKIGLDVRLMNPMLPDDPNSKLNVCVQNVLKIWEEGKDQKLTQLLFCDLSTPKNDGNFNVYDDIRKKLVAAGVPENEIEFIHNADTEAKKAALFSKVRSGDVRVLLGSTAKMGAGTNVQSRLVAVHHLDVGWKPSDMTQRNGRIIRQGNMNKEVKVFNYVTEGTFDSYLFVRHEVA